MAGTPYMPVVKCSTTNIQVFVWQCVYCRKKNLTLESDSITGLVKGARSATCCKCGTGVSIKHHTFK